MKKSPSTLSKVAVLPLALMAGEANSQNFGLLEEKPRADGKEVVQDAAAAGKLDALAEDWSKEEAAFASIIQGIRQGVVTLCTDKYGSQEFELSVYDKAGKQTGTWKRNCKPGENIINFTYSVKIGSEETFVAGELSAMCANKIDQTVSGIIDKTPDPMSTYTVGGYEDCTPQERTSVGSGYEFEYDAYEGVMKRNPVNIKNTGAELYGHWERNQVDSDCRPIE